MGRGIQRQGESFDERELNSIDDVGNHYLQEKLKRRSTLSSPEEVWRGQYPSGKTREVLAQKSNDLHCRVKENKRMCSALGVTVGMLILSI